MKPICFKVRGGGNCSGTKGGPVRPGVKGGGTGMLYYEDKTFTVATGTDQYIAISATNNNMSHEQPNIPQQITQGKPIRYLSVCSGMEAASVAWHPLGWKPIGFSEIEPFPCAILKHRFPDVPNYGDLTKYAEWPLSVGDVDLICGGTPCQAFSVAGLRQGLADPRGNLALVFLGLVDRLRPKYVLWENVPGVLSSNGGEDFAAFVGALAELGYGFAWRCVDAQFFGVPQRRKRLYLLAVEGAGNWRAAAEILFEPEGLRGDFASGEKKGEVPSSDARGSVNSFRKARRAQSVEDFETWVPDEKSNTLNTFDLTGEIRSTHAVVEPIIFEPRSQDGHARICNGVSPTLNTAQGGQRQPCVAVPNCEISGTIRANPGSGFRSDGSPVEPVVMTPMAVRRLTCVETERLQGFPDNWSRIPWKVSRPRNAQTALNIKQQEILWPCLVCFGLGIGLRSTKRKPNSSSHSHP